MNSDEGMPKGVAIECGQTAQSNGPNLNLIEKRNEAVYGPQSLAQIQAAMAQKYPEVDFIFLQSNHEGVLIDTLQATNADAVIINPGGLTHTSVALRDTLEMLNLLKVEVHLSDINNREEFRKRNYISEVVNQQFVGKQGQSYLDAVDYILKTKEGIKK
jgi:3-dehydroquinate dehydratase-2